MTTIEYPKLLCPHCGEEIPHLNYTEELLQHGTAEVNAFWDIEYNPTDELESDEGAKYFCPECEKEIRINSETKQLEIRSD